MKILTTEQMQAIDRRAIEEIGIPGLVLMENAAIGVVDAIAESYPKARRVTIYCGPGNNGGDGLAIGRHLSIRGYRVRLVVVTNGRPLSGDASTQEQICRRQGLAPHLDSAEEGAASLLAFAEGSDLLVDALFGTGLTRPLEGKWAEIVERIAADSRPVVAVDLPSGLDAGRAAPPGPHSLADLTVTFAAPKIAHLLPPACQAVGEVVVADLGAPPWLVEEGAGDLELLDPSILVGTLPERPAAAHKGDYGHLMVVAGSPGKGGAAVLSATGAVRSGAGLVTAAVPSGIADGVDQGSVESMTLALPSHEQGEIASEAAAIAIRFAREMQAAAIGPGLGQSPETAGTIRSIVGALEIPIVLDADGINAFAGRPAELAERSAPTVVTPHPGELARLLGSDTATIVADRLAAVEDAARATGSVVVLKGYRSLVGTPEGRIWVNPTGNSGMASGGSGDVLTGMVGAFLAQRISAPCAALLAVYLHGLAGDLAADRYGEFSLRASNLLELLPAAFERLTDA